MVKNTQETAPLPKNLVIFDGVCGLCDAAVDRLIRWDKDEALVFSPYQGDTFNAIHERHPHLEPSGSIIFVAQTPEGESVFTHSTAIFEIVRRLRAPYSWLSAFRIFPTALTDWGYNVIAKNRYKFFGKRDTCRLPTPSERARFLT